MLADFVEAKIIQGVVNVVKKATKQRTAMSILLNTNVSTVIKLTISQEATLVI